MINELMRGVLIGPENYGELRFPILVSTKYDGIRCFVHPKLGAISRSFKPIRNRHVRKFLSADSPYVGCDGELIAINPLTFEYEPFNKTSSVINAYEGSPLFVFLTFDLVNFSNLSEDFFRRSERLDLVARSSQIVKKIEQRIIHSVEELEEEITRARLQGEEGLMLRRAFTPYRPGRCSFEEQNVMKIKFWEFDEAKIIGFEELMHNDNELERDNFGYAKRSKKQEGMRPGNMLGKLLVENEMGQFAIGGGFTEAERIQFWNMQEVLLGKSIQFKYIPKGVKSLPRSPIYLKLL